MTQSIEVPHEYFKNIESGKFTFLLSDEKLSPGFITIKTRSKRQILEKSMRISSVEKHGTRWKINLSFEEHVPVLKSDFQLPYSEEINFD